MINKYKPYDIKTLKHEFINNWFFCLDAYNDFCGCFESGNIYIELRIYPKKEGWGIFAVFGDSLNDIKRKKNIYSNLNKKALEVRFKELLKENTPESYLKKFGFISVEVEN